MEFHSIHRPLNLSGFAEESTASLAAALQKAYDADFLEKGKEMPIGTISHGRKKMPDGSWQPVSEGKSGGSSESVKDSTLKTIAYSERPAAEEKRQELELSMIKKDSRYDAKRYKDLMYGDDDAYEPTYQAMTKDVNKKIDALVKEYKKSNKSN